MTRDDGDRRPSMLLGQSTSVAHEYSPHLLYSIPRSDAREKLGLSQSVPFYGLDGWHAYELSWLDNNGKPLSRVGRFEIPATSPCLVESKSFKLYLNSLNNTRFANTEQARHVIIGDISAAAGEAVTLQLWPVDDSTLAGAPLPGVCLDELSVPPVAEPPSRELLQTLDHTAEEVLYSHLLRSLCPVTGQPDWASVWVSYRGRAIDHPSLLHYIISYRQHQEYHEQCVERMFMDIYRCCQPDLLSIQACYTRRGGLDINPFRSTDPGARPHPRLDRQ